MKLKFMVCLILISGFFFLSFSLSVSLFLSLRSYRLECKKKNHKLSEISKTAATITICDFVYATCYTVPNRHNNFTTSAMSTASQINVVPLPVFSSLLCYCFCSCRWFCCCLWLFLVGCMAYVTSAINCIQHHFHSSFNSIEWDSFRKRHE